MIKSAVLLILLTFSFISFHPKWVNGAELKVANDLIIINTNSNELGFIKRGVLERTFKVATGSPENQTPTGTFKIVNKIKDRPYYKKNIPGGSPDNPLGDRWLGLNINGTWGTTYAIHGNNNEKSIGQHISEGCIRMYNREIRWLFDHISTDTIVIITKTSKSFAQVANQEGYQITESVKSMNVSKKKEHHKPAQINSEKPKKKLFQGQIVIINTFNHSIGFISDAKLLYRDYGTQWNIMRNLPNDRYLLKTLKRNEYSLYSFNETPLIVSASTTLNKISNDEFKQLSVIEVSFSNPYNKSGGNNTFNWKRSATQFNTRIFSQK
ncbi:L,D-transpeptidase [Peribacillus frigoritolerans]|uniref:L,D-transpeptidase n=1 Tax=Peribacillus frigoritolerans TaxID=450367 RepID=UPI001059AD78|nr:L,D-transpeptidase [Peribacillus frigoritolerans]TDL76194.1 L,D-transpeptidase [Peribacillus frigoritolerans]